MSVKESVAAFLQKNEGTYISGSRIAESIGCSRNAVWKAIQDLKQQGVPIDACKKRGYCQTREADFLSETDILRYRNSHVLGYPIYLLEKTDSTNDYCRRLYETGATHGTIVIANEQSHGRGQHGKSFLSPPGTGLYFSILLRQSVAIQDATLLTACAALATAQAIDILYDTSTKIKWVNDILLNGKKCCGILTEGGISLETGELDYAIIGIGVNVRMTKDTLPESLHDSVTSIEESVPGSSVRRAELLSAILYHLERILPNFQSRKFLQAYRQRSMLLGQKITVTDENGCITHAIAEEITDDCGLKICEESGTTRTLYSASESVSLDE